jgi:hypothetical protein
VGAALEEGKWLDFPYHEDRPVRRVHNGVAGQIPDNATGGAEVAPIEVEAGTDSLPIPSRT